MLSPVPQRTYRTVVAPEDRNGMVVEGAHGILMSDLVDVTGGKRPDAAPQMLRGIRPRRVRVRIIRLPTDRIDPDVLSIAQSKIVINKAGNHMASKHITGLLRAEVSACPGPMLSVGKVGALEEVRNPA